MLYEDKNLYEELLELLEYFMDYESHSLNYYGICPYCKNDLRTPNDCDHCDEDHCYKACLRQGKHANDCLLYKHAVLVELDQIPPLPFIKAEYKDQKNIEFHPIDIILPK